RLQGDWSSDVCSSDLLRRPGAVAQARARREGPDAAEPALRLPDPEAALRSLYAGDGGAGVRLAQGEVHQGRGDVAREFGTRPHQRVRLRGGLDPAHLRCPDDQLLRTAPAVA